MDLREVYPIVVSPHPDDWALGALYPVSQQSLRTVIYIVGEEDVVGIYDSSYDQRLDTIPIIEITQHIEKEKEGLLQPHETKLGCSTRWSIEEYIVFIPTKDDRNMDHVITHHACLPAFRPYRDSRLAAIIEYPVMDSTLDSFIPNLFLPLGRKMMNEKIGWLKRWCPDHIKEPRDEYGIQDYHRNYARYIEGYTFAEAYRILWMRL